MPYQPLYGAPSGVASQIEGQNAQMGQMWSKLLQAYAGQQMGAGSAAPAGTTTGFDASGQAASFAPGANVWGTFDGAGNYQAAAADPGTGGFD